jgi:transcriptional regulator with PAS, ATPase and Fis domain
LLLDEIGDMPLTMQAKILRALEEHKIVRVGGDRPIEIDVRIIAATNRTLGQLVDEGRFRADLFYRLGGIQLQLPPLRERLDDLPELIETFLDGARRNCSRSPRTLSSQALQCLWMYPWPGNVRQLKHVLEGAALLSDGIILPEHLPPAIQKTALPEPATASGRSLDETIGDMERQMILSALGRASGVQVRAARLLGITEQSLWYRMKKYGIQARAAGSPPAGSSPSVSSDPGSAPLPSRTSNGAELDTIRGPS